MPATGCQLSTGHYQSATAKQEQPGLYRFDFTLLRTW